MDYTQKVSISKKVKNTNMILICIMASISLLGLVMAVYSLVNSKYIFALVYLVAVILGFVYVILRINAVIPTYIAIKDEHMYIQNWENGLFPFKCNSGFFGEFLPAKSRLVKIDITAVSGIYLGSRNYLLKVLDGGELYNILKNPDKQYESMLKKMDFLYVLTKDNHEIFMSVTGFDSEELGELLKPVIESDEKIDFKCNNRIISRMIPSKKIILE